MMQQIIPIRKIWASLLGVLLLAGISGNVMGQNNMKYSQYFQTGPAINPALTGVETFLDVRTAFRQQWTGFDNGPQTLYLGVYGAIWGDDKYDLKKYSLRISDPNAASAMDKKVFRRYGRRHGIGGNIFYDENGAFEQLRGALNYSYHIPVGPQSALSLGVAGVIRNTQIDLAKFTLAEMGDQVLNDLIQNGESVTFAGLDAGITLYNPNYYIGYSAGRLAEAQIGGNETVQEAGNGLTHQLMGGVRFLVAPEWEILPSVLFVKEQDLPSTWDVNAKVRFKERFYLGGSYREDNTIVGMFGAAINNLLHFGYSYDFSSGDYREFSDGTHEIVLGLMINNPNGARLPYLW